MSESRGLVRKKVTDHHQVCGFSFPSTWVATECMAVLFGFFCLFVLPFNMGSVATTPEVLELMYCIGTQKR